MSLRNTRCSVNWKLIWLATVGLALHAQTLQLPSEVTATRGGEVIMPLTLANGRIRPSALQWEMIVPVEEAILESSSPGAMAKSLGKTLQCSGEWKKAGKTYAYRCILAGGIKVLNDGDVAELKFKIRRSSGATQIRVEKAKGVSPDLKAFDFKPSEGKIVVR